MSKNTIFTIFLILSVQILNISCESILKNKQTPTKMINIGYLSYTYDIYQGNPNPTAGFDPGFDEYPIFNFAYTQNTLTADGRYLVPDKVNVIGQQICNLDFTSSTITGTQSYANSLEVSVSVSGGYGPASFSASADYKTVQQGTSSNSNIYVSNQGICSVYNAIINPSAFPTIHPNFLAEVKKLPTTYTAATKSAYMSFLQKHGTHYFKSMNMGSKYGYISTITQDSWTKLSQQGITVSLAASYSAMVSVGVSTTTDIQKTQASSFDSLKSDYKQVSIGSAPPPDGNIVTWANNCYGNPMPITYSLDNIANLFVASFMTGVTGVPALQTNINSALVDYCGYLQSLGKLSSCTAPTPDKPLPQVLNSCRYCAGSCGGTFTVDGGTMSADGSDYNDFSLVYDNKCGSNPQRRAGSSPIHLCCQPETPVSTGNCRHCATCGGNFTYDEGGMFQTWQPGWSAFYTSYDNGCKGDLRFRNTPIHLCCDAPICTICLSCGGAFPQETGVFSYTHYTWNSQFAERGIHCGTTTFSNNDFGNNGVSLCCANKGVPN